MSAPATTTTGPAPPTTQLRLSSGNGPVYRTVLRTPLRDALPSEIPIIDASRIFSPSLDDRLAAARDVHDAAANTGFFYIRDHGIPAATTDAACAAALAFFRQDFATKQRADSSRSRFMNGWKGPRTQRINPSESVDVRETFSWRYDPGLDPARAGDAGVIPAEIAEHLKCEDFPWEATENLPRFREALVRYWQACLGLGRALVRTFALSLSLPEDAWDGKFSHPDAAFAINYYPPIDNIPSTEAAAAGGGGDGSAPAEEEEVSIGSHTDFQLFTILWQDSNGGLQVLNRAGQWIRAAPIPGTLVVNIADYLQRVTNDRYVSTVHRVQNRSGRERVSMPFFFGFNLNESCGVLDSCVGDGERKKYEEISCLEWVQRRAEEMHKTEGDEGQKKEK